MCIRDSLYRVQKGDAVEMIDRTGVTRFSMERGDDFTALKKRFVLYKDCLLYTSCRSSAACRYAGS